MDNKLVANKLVGISLLCYMEQITIGHSDGQIDKQYNPWFFKVWGIKIIIYLWNEFYPLCIVGL